MYNIYKRSHLVELAGVFTYHKVLCTRCGSLSPLPVPTFHTPSDNFTHYTGFRFSTSSLLANRSFSTRRRNNESTLPKCLSPREAKGPIVRGEYVWDEVLILDVCGKIVKQEAVLHLIKAG